jgi:acyl carrier protein
VIDIKHYRLDYAGGGGHMELQEITEAVKKAIAEVISKDGNVDGTQIANNDSLIDSGLLDSLGAIQIIEAFSEKFNVIFYPAELSLDNFDSVDKIARFIQAKLIGEDA